jgi:purine-binding chemotaxis protein CheW
MGSVIKEHDAEFDWQHLHRRLAAAWSALEQKLSPDATARQEVMRARAKALAQAPGHDRPAEKNLEIVEFLLANEHYGVESAYVREVCPLRDLRRLTGTPDFILGLVHVRGQIVSVIDIKRFFELPDNGLTDLNRILIVRSGPMEAGILADAIVRVQSIGVADLQPALPTLTGLRADYVRGITRDPVVVLDVEKFLSDKRIVVDEV